MQRYALSIDCGSTGTGIACWDYNKWGDPINPIYTMNIYPRRKRKDDDWLKGALDIAKQFRDHLRTFEREELSYAVFELPEYFDSALGNSVAKTGRLAKLLINCGMLVEAVVGYHHADVKMYPVHIWKGQLSKPVIVQRIRKALPSIDKINPTTHSWDAIGLGLYDAKLINQQRRAKDRPRVV